MSALLSLSRMIDALNQALGKLVSYALLLAVIICTGNALVRYAFNISSNAWLELQWYLYGAMFLGAASYTLKRDEHVRIDVIVGRFSKRTQVIIDLLGFLFFMMPICLLIVYYSWPYALLSFESKELSTNAGGLIVWPAKMLIPFGFALLSLQGVSEIIKRAAYLMGLIDSSAFDKQQVKPEDEVAAIKAANNLK
ncbi:TRAP transporter small permease subunit [Massilia sp. W12]|uniref:TRAP transporter small permease subunit n=1 Tax=Massilia sp. W12 TaxID=3126507 RepID=UPI0030CC8502